MPDQELPQSVGDVLLPPPSLSPKQEELCKRLDLFYIQNKLEVKPSDMFRGAIFAMKAELRSNPDWMAQAANSLRDILYPFGHEDTPNQDEAFRQFGSVRRVFGTLTQLTHHGHGRGNMDYLNFSPADFENLVSSFEDAMFNLLDRQIDIHKEIDSIMAEALKPAEIPTIGEEIL